MNRIPNHELCALIVQELLEHHEKTGELSDWEFSFCESNQFRKHFTDPQKLVIQKFTDKYVLDCTKGYV